MPEPGLDRLQDLASTEAPSTMTAPDKAAMQEVAPATSTAGPAPAGPGAEQPGQEGDGGKMDKVGQLMVELADVCQEITQVDPRTTMIIKDGLERIYLQISKVYGVEDEVKLRMRKSGGQQQSAGMNQMTGMTQPSQTA